MNIRVNMTRIRKWYEEIHDLTANDPNPGYTRLAFSPEEKAAHQWLTGKLEAIYCTVETDALNNIYGTMGPPDGPAIAFGSHLDTVPSGGLYDGTLGILSGLECLYQLHEQNVHPAVPLKLICFTGEEANPLGGTFGSRAIAGLIDLTADYEVMLNQKGYSADDVLSVHKTAQDFLCFLEMHIEQGAVLEQAHKSIGIVEGIAGMLRLAVHIKGKAAHAGTTPMSMREDALVFASELVIKVNAWASEPGSGVVATVGRLKVHPDSPSVVPGEVQLIVEIRGIDWAQILLFKNKIQSWLSEHQQNDYQTIVEKHPAVLSKSVIHEIHKACLSEKIPFMNMISGANHDANAMSTLTDTGMIFVPSRNGISHHPEEFTSWGDIESGIRIMMSSLMNLHAKYNNK